MASKTEAARDKFFDAINETYDAFISGIEAAEERGHRVSQRLLNEARKSEEEVSTLGRTWANAPTRVHENLAAMIDAQARSQRRALEMARDSLKGTEAYRDEVREALRRVIRANRTGTDAMVDVARAATSRAAKEVDRLPLPRRSSPRPRPSRIAVVEGNGAETKAG
ncbi:MAG: hypothetical protein WEE64_00740 [Dehalococcoidia bacterium]